MKEERTGILILVLVIVILILSSVIVYAFVIKPMIQNYRIENQNVGVNIAIANIIGQLQQNGYVQIPISENQTIVLVPLQQQQPVQQPTTEETPSA